MFSSKSNQRQAKGGKASGNKRTPPHKLANTFIKVAGKDKHASKAYHRRNKHHGVHMHPEGGYNAGTAAGNHEEMYCNGDE